MDMLDKCGGGVKKTTDAMVAMMALTVVLLVLFGSNLPFFPVDVVGNIVALTKSLGAEGLVGLVAVYVLMLLFSNKSE